MNADFENLHIYYKQSFFIEWPIDHLTDNKVESLKVISIKQFLDNIIYESNPQNEDFDDLSFDVDERLIARQRLYCINDNIIILDRTQVQGSVSMNSYPINMIHTSQQSTK